jgi:hypothetical protein
VRAGMKTLNNKELREIIQSGHINLLIGSGCSLPYLTTLNNIEQLMNEDTTREQAQKEYYGIIRKSKAVLDPSRETNSTEKYNLEKTLTNYDDFVSYWAEVISTRSLNIVNKQVNIFTTNFDMFVEDACERLQVPYNDGFAGQLYPKFSVGNFNKIQKYKSLQFDNTSDIPLFNIIKLHGSLSWQTRDNEVIYSDGSHIKNDLDKKSGESFLKDYQEQLAVINPTAEKHFETVMDTNYASMLRKFTLELEKENSVLFIFGCSLADRHIKDLLYSAMRSNPTLVVVYFSFSPYDEVTDKRDETKNPNLYIIAPEAGSEQPFDKATSRMRSVLFANKVDETLETQEDVEEQL